MRWTIGYLFSTWIPVVILELIRSPGHLLEKKVLCRGIQMLSPDILLAEAHLIERKKSFRTLFIGRIYCLVELFTGYGSFQCELS